MADWYIRDGASGANDGTDWTDAWEDTDDIVWGGAGVARGDTIYIADGTYLGDTFSLADSGTDTVTLQKATVAAHGTETGWDNAYGDGQAEFIGQTVITSDYWVFDGVGRNSADWEDGSSYGFRFHIAGTEISLINLWNANERTDLTFKYCEFEPAGEDQAVEQHIFRVYNVHNLTLQYCYLHDVETTIFQIYAGCYGFTLEYSVLARRHNGTSNHGEFFMLSGFDNPAAIVIRYNIMHDCYGSGMIYFDNSDHDGGAEIYGNVLYQTSSRYGTSNGLIGGGSSYNYTDIKVYNNTLVDAYIFGGSEPTNFAVYFPGASSTGNLVYNNVCINTGGVTLVGDGNVKDYNLYNDAGYAAADNGHGQNYAGGTTLFVNYTNDDYHLAAATDAGTTLDSPYNQDMDGVTRAVDGVWDRGAVEYGEGSEIEKLVMILK